MTSTSINNLSSVDSLAAGDLLPIFDASNSDARKVSVSTLSTYMQDNLTFSQSSFTTQYSAPNASGFSVTITGTGINVHLILTPAAGYAAGTIVLPAVAGVEDKQTVLVNCTQAVTTLTVSGNGAGAVVGAPTTLSANDFFTLKYDAATTNWYRVG